ncbi:roadblock/LC7 domain-containing protein [Streptomyces sp. NPDC058417]|uniref:roadblock/LC7 domain-containing protein n=1 Tax=unclassified Streptomyces TaxID=2593676 RepID=UPI003657C9A5
MRWRPFDRQRPRPEKHRPTAAGPEILAELRRLRARVPRLTGALAAGADGIVLAHDTPGVAAEGVAALTTTALGAAVRLTDTSGQGELRELLVRGADGYVAAYAAGEHAVLTLLARDEVNVGRLHLEGRRSAARIGALLDGTVRPRPATPLPALPPAPPAATPPPAAPPTVEPLPVPPPHVPPPPAAPAPASSEVREAPARTTTKPRTTTES